MSVAVSAWAWAQDVTWKEKLLLLAVAELNQGDDVPQFHLQDVEELARMTGFDEDEVESMLVSLIVRYQLT